MFEKDRGKAGGVMQTGGGNRAPRQPLRQPSIKDIARLARVASDGFTRAAE